MNIGDVICGFQLLKITELSEIGGTFYEMIHQKNGAKLGWLKNEDVNKTFAITFRTIPENDTGVFHILEHSVLQGSWRYPVKAPFVELIKTSMNTFLNAMTFPDKTMYPVSSRNEKDFENLIHVYMDAVLHPALYKNENIFLQEGWHYEFAEEEASSENDGAPFFNGVVLNEMRGAESSVDSLMYEGLQAALFPENCYHYCAGGAPEHIPDLTYEAYKDTHRRFYHPSNSYILLEGKLDPERILHILNDEFLCDFTSEDWNSADIPDIPVQTGKGLVRTEKAYAVEEPGDHQGYLALGYVTGMFSDMKKAYAVKILADYLTDSNEAPVKKAILSSGLAYDVMADFADSMMQPFLMIAIRNMEPEDREKIEKLVEDTIRSVKEKGLDRDQLDALLAQLEFEAKERNFGGYPEGLVDCMTIMNSWLYGGEPTEGLESGAIFAELRKEIQDGSFDRYLDEFILENNHRASICMIPSETCMEEAEKKEQQRLEDFWASLSESEKEDLRQKEKALKAWQSLPNTEEDCKCLPMLALSDVSEDPITYPLQVLEDGTLWHGTSTKGICYLRAYLPLQDLTEKEYSELSFACGLLGELPLTDMGKAELDMEKRRTFGNLSIDIMPISDTEDWKKAKVWLCLSVSYLKEKEPQAKTLLSRILGTTDWNSTSLIGELLRQQVDGCQQNMIMNGHRMAMLKALATSTEKGRINNLISGPAYVDWVQEANEACQADAAAFCQKLGRLTEKVLACSPEKAGEIIVSMTADGEQQGYKETVIELLPKADGADREAGTDEAVEASQDNGAAEAVEATGAAEAAGVDEAISADEAIGADEAADASENDIMNIGAVSKADCSYISIPAPVAYSAKAGNINAWDIPNTGSWLVFSKLASMDYLWNRIRVLGGAYGTGMSVGVDGTVMFYSYRDPSPEKSLETYCGTPAYMKGYCAEDHDLTGIIIGSISDTEPLVNAAAMGGVSDMWYLTGITDELRRQRRSQILHTSRAQLAELAEHLDRAVADLDSCIVSKTEG